MIYNLLALTKIIVCIFVALMMYNYVNFYEDTSFTLPIFLLWILFFVWWVTYFIFYGLEKILTNKSLWSISAISYKQSLLIGVFFFINIGLLSINRWSYIFAFVSLIFMIVLEYFLTKYEFAKAR